MYSVAWCYLLIAIYRCTRWPSKLPVLPVWRLTWKGRSLALTWYASDTSESLHRD